MVIKHRPQTIALTVLLIIVIGIAGSWIKFLYTPLITDEHGMKYTVRAGTSIRAVIDDLYVQNVVKHPLWFKLLVRIKGVSHELKAGEYLFPKGTTPSKMLHQIVTGSGMVYYTYTIVPGWTFKDVRNALLHNSALRHTVQNMSNADVMQKLGHPELKPEGEFYPDTYYFVENSDDFLLLKRAFKAMQEKLDKAWQHRDPGLPFKTPYEALIGASIIEKEAFIEDELPKIAGVMVNRLRKGMLLQFDPTVIYGAGARYDGKIRRADLVANNPYNTYVHKGLTPTPISMPGAAAIDAIMHPMKHDYYYFVAQSSGSTQFTKQLSEHYKAVAVARSTKWFFNSALARYYLLNLLSQKIYNVN